jgi:hypothetical protein
MHRYSARTDDIVRAHLSPPAFLDFRHADQAVDLVVVEGLRDKRLGNRR